MAVSILPAGLHMRAGWYYAGVDMPRKPPELTPELIKELYTLMGKRGGTARAKSLTAKQRKQQASEAAKARWAATKRKVNQ